MGPARRFEGPLRSSRSEPVRARSGPLVSLRPPRAGGGIRTHDRLITNQVLYQLSYASDV